MSEQDKKSKRERRKRARATLAWILKRVQQICRTVESADDLVTKIADAVKDINDFVEGTEAKELLPEKARKSLQDATDRFAKAKDQIGTYTEACDRLQKALKYAHDVIPKGMPSWVGAVVGVVVIAAVAAGTAAINDTVTIYIENRGVNAIYVDGVLGNLPGVELPGTIHSGGMGVVEVPRAFVGGFEAQANQIAIKAFGITMPVPVNNLDLQMSAWDGISLAKLEGKPILVKSGNTHSLVIVSR